MENGKQKAFLKIVFVGDSGVGKTSLIQKFHSGKYSTQFKPTIGADFCNKEMSVKNTLVTIVYK